MLRVGDRVLAQWPAEMEWWYPGVIVAVDGQNIQVQYDDGDRADLRMDQAQPLEVRIGTRVFGRWQGGTAYYPGVVSDINGSAIHINYDDGDREWSTVGMVRINRRDRALV